MAAALIVASLGAFATEALAVRPLVVYSPHGSEILKAIATEFEKQHPGLRVEWRFLGGEEIFDRLVSEKGRPVADVWWGGPHFTFIRAARKGVLTPYKPTWSAAVPESARGDGDFWYGDMQTPLTVLYNKNLVDSGSVPRDWDELLLPALKDKIILRHPGESGTMRALIMALIDRQLGAGKTLDQAFAWLAQLEGQVARYAGHSQVMFSTVGKGVMPFSVWNLSEIVMRSRQGYPVEPVFPQSGMPVIFDSIALVKRDSAHPLAHDFYEFVTGKDVAAKLAGEPYLRVMARNDLAPALRSAFLSDPRFKVLPINWDRVADRATEWLARWEKDIYVKTKMVEP